MEFQIYDASAANPLINNFFNNKSVYNYNNNNYSLALDIMDNDDYFNWNASETKLGDNHQTTLHQQSNGQNNNNMMLLTSRKRKLLNSNEDSSVVVDDSSDSSSVDSTLTAGGHDSVIKAPPAKAIMLKVNNDGHKMMMQHKVIANGGGRMPQWRVEDIAELNADIEGSLNGGGGHPPHPTFNMNDAILSISGLTVFKQEAPSPTSTTSQNGHCQDGGGNNGRQLVHNGVNSQYIVRPNNNNNDNNNNNVVYNNGQPQMNGYSSGHRGHNHTPNGIHDGHSSNSNSSSNSSNMGSPNLNQHVQHVQADSSYSPNITSINSTPIAAARSGGGGEQRPFQYVLAAATSIATKINEDTLTYLNQGQSYEIKLKPLSPSMLSQCRGNTLQSIIRVCFHERRLQYMEREQMLSWQRARPGDRILEMDVPLSYGVSDVMQPINQLNSIQFNWDPSKDTGAYIKVNCISTEFTPKKHGGEKGVPFRIQVATYDNTVSANAQPVLLHAAACQVKVFKLKGADRKHKQDRDKVLKRPTIEQDKFQPSYDCTILNDISSGAVVSCVPTDAVDSLPHESYSRNGGEQIVNTAIVPKLNREAKPALIIPPSVNSNNSNAVNGAEEISTDLSSNINDSNTVAVREDNVAVVGESVDVATARELSASADPSLAARWLVANRFERYLTSFGNFSGADLLRMSREDLIQVCGQPDGIRLYNALHSKTIAPALTLYVARNRSAPYHAIYLRSFSTSELRAKLSATLSLDRCCVSAIYLQGPQSIHVHLEDAVLRHIRDETMFNVAILHQNSPTNNNFAILLKPETNVNVKGSSSSFDDHPN